LVKTKTNKNLNPCVKPRRCREHLRQPVRLPAGPCGFDYPALVPACGAGKQVPGCRHRRPREARRWGRYGVEWPQPGDQAWVKCRTFLYLCVVGYRVVFIYSEGLRGVCCDGCKSTNGKAHDTDAFSHSLHSTLLYKPVAPRSMSVFSPCCTPLTVVSSEHVRI
jgi:hypothetical protein